MNKKDLIISKKSKSNKRIILAHGAGAPMDHDWMNSLSDKLVSRDIQVIRFEFPYMAQRRVDGKKRPPNTKKILLETWKEVFELCADSETFIAGKSMGGRMATLMADELTPKGVICLGFPFHAPGKDVRDRIDHLKNIKTKVHILQGTRDSMGAKDEVLGYDLSKNISLHWFEDGDHSLKPRKRETGKTLEDYLELAADRIESIMS
ncbi:conserved hypothetical protein [Halobacteriovorax marinus SJ]|uniref:KANL3/Tex30 alpha/beta hydrolase-like domain-containing protein n=1 Tax=Halobacteriovorax marinus (strain ATCC BAA-682 / DSM 15412 / SJ) TaxID=862908 RepID=E1X4R0_HALMS|nr:alpha/beta family hydrolase [Halobacteriovorax marinus]CBW27136.1 conserved hypothetical protein [Halobacteriovorax marinus SJ]